MKFSSIDKRRLALASAGVIVTGAFVWFFLHHAAGNRLQTTISACTSTAVKPCHEYRALLNLYEPYYQRMRAKPDVPASKPADGGDTGQGN